MVVPLLPKPLWPFLARLSFPNGLEKCWVWNGATGGGRKAKHAPQGTKLWAYGQVQIDKKTTPVHRAFYTHMIGPIPAGLTLDHLCENKLCVNPYHLDPCTSVENLRRWREKHGPTNHRYSTTCRNGHDKTLDNVKVTKQGRLCLICLRAHRRRRDKIRRERERQRRGDMPQKTTCIHGHPFTGNRRQYKGGTYCIECNRIAAREYKRRKTLK